MYGDARRILIIDRQEYWRKLSTHVLLEAGFEVFEADNYEDSWKAFIDTQSPPDLIVLGCATIGPEEKTLIQEILERKLRLLVLCATLPWRVMRQVFLLGAEDVADKTYDPHNLLETVDTVLNTSMPTAPGLELMPEVLT